MTRPLAESSSFLWHYLADLGHNHLATLVVSTIHSDCHVTMRTGQSIQRVKLETRMPCPHTLWFSRCWEEMLQAPRYFNPAHGCDPKISRTLENSHLSPLSFVPAAARRCKTLTSRWSCAFWSPPYIKISSMWQRTPSGVYTSSPFIIFSENVQVPKKY